MNKLLSQSHGSSSVHLGMKMWWRSQWGRSGIEATLDLGNVTMDDHKKKKIIYNRSKHFCCTSCSCVKIQHLRPPAETRPSALPLTCIYFAGTGLMFLFQTAAALSFRVTNTEHSAHTVVCFRLHNLKAPFLQWVHSKGNHSLPQPVLPQIPSFKPSVYLHLCRAMPQQPAHSYAHYFDGSCRLAPHQQSQVM